MFIFKIKGVDSFRAGFLHHSSIVMDRALRHPRILEVILSEEGTGSGIWDAVSKLHAVCSKSSRQEEVAWMFHHMHDSRVAGLLDPNQSVRFFTGEGRPGGKGHCDLLLYKLKFRDYMVGYFLPSTEAKDLPEKYRVSLKEVFSSHAAFRAKFGFPSNPKDLSWSWKAGWSRSADHILQLVQDREFHHFFHDATLAPEVFESILPLSKLSSFMHKT